MQGETTCEDERSFVLDIAEILSSNASAGEDSFVSPAWRLGI